MNIKPETLLTVYCLRHLPSNTNVQGYGPADTELIEKQSYDKAMIELVEAIGINNIDLVIRGTLKRHRQTFDSVLGKAGYHGELIEDGSLNALISGPLVEAKGSTTEKKYNLSRFETNGSLYTIEIADGIKIAFDPKQMGIFPFDPLYSLAYISKPLREIVFPDEQTLASFQDIGEIVENYQTNLVKIFKSHLEVYSRPLTVVTISSCSADAFNLEYSHYGTVGENMVSPTASKQTPDMPGTDSIIQLHRTRFGSENRLLFPQNHDEVMILGYDSKNLEEGLDKLTAFEGNIKIETLRRHLS